MQLSIRLAAVADLARDARRLADIGTDHAYVPIYLALQGRLEHAVAMDINRGPLLRAQEHIRQYHLQEKIETRLSDGAENLLPGEADTAVIAGMGGALTVRILQAGRRQLADVETLVLQPQSEIGTVRRFLQENGFCITAEDMVKDEGKYYPMMRAVHGRPEAWSEEEYAYGKYLIGQKNPYLAQFLEREEQICAQILKDLRKRRGAHIEERAGELSKKMAIIRAAQTRLNGKSSPGGVPNP